VVEIVYHFGVLTLISRITYAAVDLVGIPLVVGKLLRFVIACCFCEMSHRCASPIIVAIPPTFSFTLKVTTKWGELCPIESMFEGICLAYFVHRRYQ
jgi:hypothetical protein